MADNTNNKSVGEISKGRVVKRIAPVEYTPDLPKKGGRVVKLMPRQLKKIKNGQENERV